MAWIRNRPTGLTYRDAAQSFPGYTLYASARGHQALLLDDAGQVVHAWFHPEGIQHLRWLPNGNLLVHTLPPESAEGAELIGGSAAALVELDWDSRVVWSYRDPYMHHDYLRLPSGNHTRADPPHPPPEPWSDDSPGDPSLRHAQVDPERPHVLLGARGVGHATRAMRECRCSVVQESCGGPLFR